TYVGCAAVVSNDVAWLQVRNSDWGAARCLRLGGARNLLASLSVCPRGQARAVEGAWAGSTPSVRCTNLGVDSVYNLLTGGASCWLSWCRSRVVIRSEEHTSELQSRFDIVCRLLLVKKKSKSC